MRLHKNEQLIHEIVPSIKLLVIWFFSKCIKTALLGGVILSLPMVVFTFGLAFRKPYQLDPSVFVEPISDALLLSFSLTLIYHFFLLKTYRYIITDMRCVFEGGIVRRVERSVPYHKITDIERRQYIYERILGLWSIKIFTPGTASPKRTLLSQPDAELDFDGLTESDIAADTIIAMVKKARD